MPARERCQQDCNQGDCNLADHIDKFLPKIAARNIKFAGGGTLERVNPAA
jgi:hypothetical protein